MKSKVILIFETWQRKKYLARQKRKKNTNFQRFLFVLISGMNFKKNWTFDRINRFAESFSPSYLIEKVLNCDVFDRDLWEFDTKKERLDSEA